MLDGLCYGMLGQITYVWLVFGKLVSHDGEEGMTNESRNMADGLLGWVRLYYVGFCLFWVIWCLNIVKKELREKWK